MSEARELLQRFARGLEEECESRSARGDVHPAHILRMIKRVADHALAAQPEPDPVPALPEWVRLDEHEDWQVTLEEGNRFWIDPSLPPDDLDRIAEACRILAARERARRAG